MTTTDMPNKIHEGRNIKRFREMLGIKQEALAFDLGEDWNQKKISILEQKETIDPSILVQVASILKVTPEAIRTFDEDSAFNFVNNFNDNSINNGPLNNHHCTFNPIDKIVQLYDEKIALYERMLKDKNDMLEVLMAQNKK